MAWTPNLIMPGVAKCGTTTFYHLLEAHPRVAGGIDKEVRFLMDADDELCTPANIRTQGMVGWADRYADRGMGDFDIWLDASPQYQYQDVALETIASLDPKPKILIVVRSPSRRLYSLYQYARYHQRRLPHVTSFAQFIEEIREPVSESLRDQKMMRSAWRDTKYDLMLDKWSAIVPAEQLFVTSIEEFAADRNSVLEELARWLGIDPVGLTGAQVERSNPTVVTRSKALRKLAKATSGWMPDSRLVRRLKNMAKSLNSAPVDKDEIVRNAELLASLDDEFGPHMQRFAEQCRTLRQERLLGALG